MEEYRTSIIKILNSVIDGLSKKKIVCRKDFVSAMKTGDTIRMLCKYYDIDEVALYTGGLK